MENSIDKSLMKILQKAEAICAREEYCDYDIQKKLISWGASVAQSEEILAYLHEYNYVSNKRYAEAFCVGKNRQLKWGRIKIAYQLRMKHMDESVIEEGLAAIEEVEYNEGLLNLAQKKWSLIHEEDRFRKEGKLIGFLQGKGYELNEIRNIIKQL